MSMSIRRTKRTETGQDDAGVARHTPERHPTSRNSLPAEDLTFLAAWRNGLVPCPGAFVRVRHLQCANPVIVAVLHGGAVATRRGLR
jgi:hypothetical protein